MPLTPPTKRLLDLLQLCNRFALIERTKVKDDHTRETDAEHSYQLAMSVWYLNTTCKLGLSDEKLLKYALVHDLPEVLAGDADSIAKHRDPTLKSHQKTKEAEAAHTLATRFAEMDELAPLLDNYEKQSDPEAQLVYAMDKLIACANMYLMQHDTYCIDHKCTKKEYLEERLSKLAAQPTVQKIFLELVELLDQHGIFYRPK